MQIVTQDVELYVDDSLMRLYVAKPKTDGKYGGILLYSEIFQLTAPIRRSVERLAGHGFVVAAPEIYHRIEPIGTVIGYDDIGRMRGNDDARRTPVAAFDADARATLDYLTQHPMVKSGQLGTMGFCIGGHLAFRAALQPDVKAAVCCYPTGLPIGKLGKEADAGTLGRVAESKAEMLIIFGKGDPHVPVEARQAISDALQKAGTTHTIINEEGEHAFMRDEGPRYDPAASDRSWQVAVNLFGRTLNNAN